MKTAFVVSSLGNLFVVGVQVGLFGFLIELLEL